MVWSKSFMDVIFGIRKIIHGSGRVPERWPDLLLTIFELQRSLIYKCLCTLWDKFHGVIKITYGHHPWNQEDPSWIRKGAWKMTRSTFEFFWVTEKCDISIYMCFARQIKWCGQNYLRKLSLVSGRSSMDKEGFLKDDQIYFCQFLSYREVRYISLYVLCETNPMVWLKSLMDIIIGVRKILHESGRDPEWWPELFL